jgi:galactitol-specific phosphotransferase system IIC component
MHRTLILTAIVMSVYIYLYTTTAKTTTNIKEHMAKPTNKPKVVNSNTDQHTMPTNYTPTPTVKPTTTKSTKQSPKVTKPKNTV